MTATTQESFDAMRAAAHQRSIDADAAREAWADKALAAHSPFHAKFGTVVSTAFENFDPGTRDAICCQLLAGNMAAAGELLRDYLLEVCEDGVLDQVEAEETAFANDYDA